MGFLLPNAKSCATNKNPSSKSILGFLWHDFVYQVAFEGEFLLPNTKSYATKNPSSKSILGFCCIILYPRWVLKRGFLLCTIFYFALLKREVCIFWVLVRLLVIPTAVLFSQQPLGCSLRLGLTSFAHGMG